MLLAEPRSTPPPTWSVISNVLDAAMRFPCSWLSPLAQYPDADVIGNPRRCSPIYEDPSFASRLLTHTGRQAPHKERRSGQRGDRLQVFDERRAHRPPY